MNKIIVLFAILLALVSCNAPEHEGMPLYDINDNFLLADDSLTVQLAQPMHTQPVDSMSPRALFVPHDTIVIAQIRYIPEDCVDSTWVMIVNNRYAMGWLHESELLQNVMPIDPISHFIHFFSKYHTTIFIIIIALAVFVIGWSLMLRQPLCLPFYGDKVLLYPMLLLLTFCTAVVLYSTIQEVMPEEWVYYYYHPTLDPFDYPFLLSMFIGSFWLMIVLLLASADEVFRHLRLVNALVYVVAYFALLSVAYVVLSHVTLADASGYVVLGLLTLLVVGRFLWMRPKYACGKCGGPLRHKGKCPNCGAVNT